MAQIVKIGNSKGVRIPKIFLIEEAQLEGKELNFRVVKDGLIISPSKENRAGWAEAVQISQSTHGTEALDLEWLDSPLMSDDEWEW
ncbi:MAG: AbrB/MazE/SpoVT family DNA-binding domain-containing protein [Nitrospirae bacterium]|nr:AbrB/MazE/SpoVT family DNA-binding domain-containing protein [Candidatus Manganitrophaceae bacterium]